ncbi:hypothetical protein ACHQM5_010163 [Ranunculus cassubicifolius]
MLPLQTCALPLHPPSFPHPRHLLQTNKLTTNDTKKLKSIRARETLSRTKSFFNLYLHLYASFGLMHAAEQLFDEMPQRTLISWTILMSGYTRHGMGNETLGAFQSMLESHGNMSLSLQPDSFVYAIVLRACTAMSNLEYGRQLHCRILKSEGVIDSYVENALVSMYAKCGCVSDAASVYDRIVTPDLVSWSSMLSGFVQNGEDEEGLRLFGEMIRSGIRPDVTVFSMAIGASANLRCLQSGTQLHCYVCKAGFASSLFLVNTLMNFYIRCADLGSSLKIFSMMSERNLVSSNTIIKGYVQNHLYHEALNLFRALLNEGFICDDFTLISILQAVTCLGALDAGREIHGYIIRRPGLESDFRLISALLDMYIDCMDFNRSSPMIHVPLKIYIYSRGVHDEFIIASLLKWCSLQLDLEIGKVLHSQIIKLDLLSDSYVVSSLMDMYSKCEIPKAAKRIFERIEYKSMVIWAVIISGFCSNGWFDGALNLFCRMLFERIEVNEYVYTSVLTACLGLGDLRKAKEIHGNIIRTGYATNLSILNTLVNLYSKLCHPRQALGLCCFIPETEISWGLLIEACTRIEDYQTNLKIFEKIQRSNGELDGKSACHILSSCSISVLLNVGRQAHAYFAKRGLMSDTLTNNSLMTMYSECGMITDAVTVFQSMPEKNSESWTSLISVNVKHGNPFEAIEMFTEMLLKNKSPDATTFVSVLEACGQAGLVDEAFCLLSSMEKVYGIEPSAMHYSAMIEVLGRAGRFESAKNFIDASIPFKPLPSFWRALLSASRIHGNMQVAKYAIEELLKLEPKNFTANLLFEELLLTQGIWGDTSKLKSSNRLTRASCCWIEIRNYVYEFTSNQIPTRDIYSKLVELEGAMNEMGYVADRNHWLHNAEEEDYEGVGLHHTEMKALAFGLLSLPRGMPIRVIKGVRMCGDCHSAFKFMSTFLCRELVVRDSCNFHHFSNGRCSCKDNW